VALYGVGLNMVSGKRKRRSVTKKMKPIASTPLPKPTLDKPISEFLLPGANYIVTTGSSNPISKNDSSQRLLRRAVVHKERHFDVAHVDFSEGSRIVDNDIIEEIPFPKETRKTSSVNVFEYMRYVN